MVHHFFVRQNFLHFLLAPNRTNKQIDRQTGDNVAVAEQHFISMPSIREDGVYQIYISTHRKLQP